MKVEVIKPPYTAVGYVYLAGHDKKLTAHGYSYKELCTNMATATAEARYTTMNINSEPSWDMLSVPSEPYTLDLIWPRVEWVISKRV